MLKVNWIKLTTGEWCRLATVDLSNVTAQGVYVIWHEGNPGRVVKIGQGDIKDRLTCHRTDPEIQTYKSSGPLRVTWAAVSAADRDGVELYLAECYPPLVAVRFPDVTAVPVNLPFAS